jgi:hypothetical protein
VIGVSLASLRAFVQDRRWSNRGRYSVIWSETVTARGAGSPAVNSVRRREMRGPWSRWLQGNPGRLFSFFPDPDRVSFGGHPSVDTKTATSLTTAGPRSPVRPRACAFGRGGRGPDGSASSHGRPGRLPARSRVLEHDAPNLGLRSPRPSRTGDPGPGSHYPGDHAPTVRSAPRFIERSHFGPGAISGQSSRWAYEPADNLA